MHYFPLAVFTRLLMHVWVCILVISQKYKISFTPLFFPCSFSWWMELSKGLQGLFLRCVNCMGTSKDFLQVPSRACTQRVPVNTCGMTKTSLDFVKDQRMENKKTWMLYQARSFWGSKAAKEQGDSTSKQRLERLESNKNYLPSNYYMLGSENRTAVLLIITRRKEMSSKDVRELIFGWNRREDDIRMERRIS